MARPWEKDDTQIREEQSYNDTGNPGFISNWAKTAYDDWDLIDLSEESRQIYDKLRHHKYKTEEEADELERRFAEITNIEQKVMQDKEMHKSMLQSRGTVGELAANTTSLGGSINSFLTQLKGTGAGYAIDAAKNIAKQNALSLTSLPGVIGAGYKLNGPSGAAYAGLSHIMANQGNITNLANYASAMYAGHKESQLEGWEAFRTVLQKGGTIEQAEQAYNQVYAKNLPITGVGSVLSGYAGSRILGGAKGILGGSTAGRALSKVSSFDPFEKIATGVAKKSGISALGTAAGIGAYETVNVLGEDVQEITQNNIQNIETKRAMGINDDTTQYNINNWVNALTSDEGIETLKETTGSTLLMSMLGLPLSGRGYVKGGYQVQKANTFGQHAIRQLRQERIKPNDPNTFDQGQYNVFKQMVGNWQQLKADEIEGLDFQDVATGYSAYRAAQIKNANPALSERQAIEIANNEFIGGISKNKSHYNGPTELSDAYKKFTEQTGTQNNYKDILVDPTLRQQQENVIEKQEAAQPTKSDAVKTPITGNFKVGSFDARTAAQAKQDNGGKPLGSPSVDSQQNIGTQTQPTANTGLEIISEQEPISHKVSELLSGTKYQVTSDRVSTGLGDNYRYNTVEVTNTETGKKELIEQKDDNTFVIYDGSGYPVPMTEVDLRNHFSQSGTINMSAEELMDDKDHEYKSRVAEEVYKGMDREENLIRSGGDFWKWIHTGDNMAKAGLTSRDVDEIAIMLGRADLSDTSIYFNTDRKLEGIKGTFGINLDKQSINNEREFEQVGNKMKTNAVIMLWNGADATTVLHELSHGGWRSLSNQQKANYIEMSLQTSKEFMCKILGLDPQISDQEFVQVYYALAANPEVANQQFLEKGILPDAVVSNYEMAFKYVEQKLLGVPENEIRRFMWDEIVRASEERYANEFTMWYFGGYLVGSKPKNYFQVMADAFCRRIADVLHACNYTADFVNSPTWKTLKAKMPDLVSQMTLYENMTLGQGVIKETAQPVPQPTIVERPTPQPVQQEQSTVQQPVVETQPVAEPVTQPIPKPVEVEPQTQPEPGPNITPDKIVEEIKKKPEVVKTPPVETKQEEAVRKEEPKKEQPKEESKKEVTIEVPEEVAQQIEEEGVLSQQEILEQIKKSTTGMVDRDKDRRYVVDGKTYSVEVDEDTHTPVVYLHVANRKEEVRPNSLIDMAILIKRRLDEASNKEEHNTIIKEAQRAKERAEDYLKTDGDKITIRLKNNAEYNSLIEKRKEIDRQIKEETNPEEKSKLQEYRKFIQGEITRVGREEQEALDYDKSIVENTNKAIVMLGKIEVQNGKQPQQTQPVQKPAEVKKNEQPKTPEVKKEQNVKKELDKQDSAIVASIKEEKGKEVKEIKQKKKETKPEPTDEEKTQAHVEKLKGYKNNTVRKAQINNKKNGWLTDPNKRKAIDILVKENPKEYLAMLPDELLDEYKDVVDKQLYEDIKNERELKNDKNAFFAKQRIRKKVMGDKYRANKEDTWEKYNKNVDFKKEVEKEVERLYQEELKNGKKTKEQLIEERSKDEDFIKKVKADVLAKINSDEEMAVLKSCYDGILDDTAKDSFLRDMAIQKIKEGYVPEGYKKKQVKNNEVYGMFTDQGSSESRDISWVDNIINEHLEPDMDSETANYLSNRVWFSNAGDLKLHTDEERKEYSNYLWNQCKEVLDQNKFTEFTQNVENIFRKEVNSYVLEGKLTVEEGEKIIAACKKYVEDQNKKKDNTNVVNKPEIKEETKEEAKEYNEQLQMTLYKYLKDSINKFDRKLITTKEAEEVFKILRKRANNKDFVKLEDFRDATNHYQAYEFCFDLVKKYSAGPANSKKIGGFIKLPQTILKNKEQIKKIILHKDGLMGAVILNNGSIGSFFYTPRESKGKLDLKDLPKNSLESLILLSISNGAVKTECMTKELSTELQKNGFQVVSSGYTSKGTKVYQLVKQQGRITDAIERVEKKQITPVSITWKDGKVVSEVEMPLIKTKNPKGEDIIVPTLDDARWIRDAYMIDETFDYKGWQRAEKRVAEKKNDIKKQFLLLKTDEQKRNYVQEQAEIYRRNALKYGRELNYALYRTLERNEDKVYGEDRPGQMNRDQRQTIIDQRAKEWGFVDKNGRVNGVQFWEEYNKRKEDIANLEDRIKNAKKYELTPEEVRDLANQLRARKFYWNWEEAYKILTTRKNMQKLTDWRIAWNKGDKTKYINENALRYFEQQLQENTIQQKSGEKFYYYAKMDLFLRNIMPNLKKKGEFENRSKIGSSYNSIWYSNVGLLNSDFEVIKRKLKDAGLDTVKWFGESKKIEDVNHVILKQIIMKDFMNIMKSKAITDKFGKYTEKEIKGFFNQKQLHTRFNLLEASKKGLFPTVLDDVNDILREKYGGLFVGIDGRIRLFASDKNSKVRSQFLCKDRAFKNDIDAVNKFRELEKKKGGQLYLRDILDHQELYEIYPGLEDSPVYLLEDGSAFGQANPQLPWKAAGFNPDGTVNEFGAIEISFENINHAINNNDVYKGLDFNTLLHSIIIHEIQHLIQGKEYFAQGNNTIINERERNAMINERYKDYLGIKGLWKFGKDFFGVTPTDLGLGNRVSELGDVVAKTRLTAEILDEMINGYEFDIQQQYNIDEFEENYNVNFNKVHQEIEKMKISKFPKDRISFFRDLLRYNKDGSFHGYKTELAKLIFNAEQYFGDGDRLEGFIQDFFYQAYSNPDFSDSKYGGSKEGWRNYKESVGEQESKFQERKVQGLADDNSPIKYGGYKYLENPYDINKRGYRGVDGLVVDRMEDGLDRISENLERAIQPHVWYSNTGIVKNRRKFIDDLPSKFKTGFSFLYKNENALSGPPSIKKIDKVLEDFSKLNNIDNDEVINKIEQLYNIKHITNSDFFNSNIQKKIENEFPNLVDMLGPGDAKEIIARKYGIAVDNSGNIWSGVRTYDNAGSITKDFDMKAIEKFMKGSHDILKDPYGGYKKMYIRDNLVDINIEKENILTDDRTEGFVVGFDKFNDVVDDKNKSQINGRLNKKNRIENKVVSEDFEDFQKDVLDNFSSKPANNRQRATYTGPVVKNKYGIYTAYVNMKNPLILTITEYNKNRDGTILIETERNGKSGLFNNFDFWKQIYSEYDSNKNDGIIFVTKNNDIILSLIPLGENKIKTIDNFGTYDSFQSHVLFSNSGNRNFHGMNYNDYHNYVDKYKDVYRVTFTKSARTFAKRQKEMEYFRTRHQEWKEIKDGENVTFERIMPYQEYKRTITYNGVNDVDNKEHLITPKERTKTQKVLDSINEYYQNTVTGMFNDLNPIYRLCKDVGALHAYEKMVVYRNQGNLAYDVISSGFKYYDTNTGKIERSTSLESIVATIGTDEVNEIDALGKETGNKMNQQWRFIMYGYAKRAIELDKRGIKQPISKNEALAIVDYIENCNDVMIDRRGNKSTVANVYKEELANFIEYNNRLLHVLVEGGLHSEEEYRRMLNANQWYIPLQKDFSEEEGDLTPISSYIHHSPSYVNLKSPLKLIKGSEYKKIKNPLKVAMERTIHFFELKAKNEVALTLIDEVIGQVTYTASNKKVLLNANIIHRIAPHKFTKKGKPVYKVSDADQTFYVMRNGQKEVYQVTDKQLFLTLRNMDQEQLKFLNKWFIKPFTMPARMIRATATATYDFGLGNVIRDTMTAWSTSENGFIPLYDSLWGMYQYVMDTQWAREYLMNNGEFTTRLAEEDINNVITVKEKQKLGQVLDRIIHPRSKIDCMRAVYTLFKDKGIMNILSKLQAFNTMMELGTRIAEYKNARMGYEQDFIGEKRFFNGGLTDADIIKATGDIIHASKVAKDITINFGQHGRWAFAKIINRFIPFFNALLQGIYKQLNTMGYATTFLTGNLKHLAMGGPQLSQAEQTRGKYALMKLGLLAIAGILKAYEGAGDPDYDDAQDWEKEANWVFASGWKWPKDQEFGRLIGGTFEKAAYRYIKGEEVGISDILIDALSCFSPDSYTPAILSLSMIFYGPGYNSFTKQQIVPEYIAKKNEVGYKQVDMYTSNMAADLSYFLYKVLHVDISAKKLDAALQNQLSNTNKYIKGFYDVAREIATGQKNPPVVPRGAQEGDWNLKDTFRKNTPAVANVAIQPIADRFNTRRNTPQQVLDFQKYYKEWSKYASTDKLTKEEERAWNIVQKANEKDANERKKKKELRKQFMAGKINEEKFLQQNQKIDEARKKIAKFVKQKTKNIDLPFVISF